MAASSSAESISPPSIEESSRSRGRLLMERVTPVIDPEIPCIDGLAMGAATREPPPPCSTKTATTRRGFSGRREGGEPGVVAVLEGQAPRVHTPGWRDHLHGAGLAGDLDPGEPGRAVGRAARLVDHRPEPLAHHRAGRPASSGTRSARRSVGVPEQMRRDPVAAVGHQRRSSPPSGGASPAPGPGRSRPRSSRRGTSLCLRDLRGSTPGRAPGRAFSPSMSMPVGEPSPNRRA